MAISLYTFRMVYIVLWKIYRTHTHKKILSLIQIMAPPFLIGTLVLLKSLLMQGDGSISKYQTFPIRPEKVIH